ncbi:MAG: TIGR03960 family B12-binding radical SAM protein [Polyangiaceae bacterium]
MASPAPSFEKDLPVHPYAAFLPRLEKPARYTGGEVGARRRAWTDDVAKVCLAFPDVYDIGMSHLGFKILYKVLNDDPRTLAERCYAPWVDLEAELKARSLPLVSLESYRALSEFDVVGFSLQFELTYSNILTMLHYGGIPLRARDRGEADPLVVAGGPVATHPEPIAPFLDAIVLGDGEEKATELAVTWKALRDRGVPRVERLRALARLGSVYVPSLYETELDPDSQLHVVKRPSDPTLPFPIERALVDLAKYPFPDESPTGGPEAIFDRMSIEVARGCTEGCRFCQAGMIYRPVRERDPEEIVETVVRAVEKSGQDEVSLTALSTADVSCISPLIQKVTDRLSKKKVALGVSSLRAYGLAPELLDELKKVRATGLTFAPEAGTQRMRDVINKNVTEEQLLETAERVFSRGWAKMKLYFIAGLPTETEEDVRGIVQTGARALAVGKNLQRGKKPEVTVSVSVHVPKPHTPFQWCAMDSLDMIEEKQAILREEARRVRGLNLRTHDARASVLEGVFARGDRRLGDVLEDAWRGGARFDSWDDKLDLPVWRAAFEAHGMDPLTMLGTLPTSARLPWDHLDVGLEDGFLAREYRQALKSRLSPPCGKVAGSFVHETTVEAAERETRRLVCYDCGVACDMTAMRTRRIQFLDKLGAHEDVSDKKHLPIAPEAPPVEVEEPAAPPKQKVKRPSYRYRFRFEKVGPVALIGHLDLVRELPRVFRRAGAEQKYTGGFHPKPDMTFAPALALGIMSLDEAVDVHLHDDLDAEGIAALLEKMNGRTPLGLRFTGAARLEPGDPSLSRMIRGARYAIVLARSALAGVTSDPEAFLGERVRAVLAEESIRVRRTVGALSKMVDVRELLAELTPLSVDGLAQVRRAGLVGDLVGFEAVGFIRGTGAAKPSEIAEVALGPDAAALPYQIVRTELVLGPPDVAAEPPVEEEAPEPAMVSIEA